MKIGTITTGVGVATTIPLTYLPQYIYWNNATTPQSLQVRIQGDGVIVDLDTAGINAFAALRLNGRVTNGFYIPLANGVIPAKNVEISFVNNVASAIDIYGFSLQKGNLYVQSLRSAVLAASGITVQKFAALAIPAIASTDVLNIEYKDGWIQQIADLELRALGALYQADVNGTGEFIIDNFAQNVKTVRFTPSANQTIYMMRFISPGSLNQNINMG
jgi:hypothetical protein